MGNQLTCSTPTEILNLEQYLKNIDEFKYEKRLGSTRFFKVAKVKCDEGPVVVKVFQNYGKNLPIKENKDRLEAINSKLHLASNCLAFKYFNNQTVNDKVVLIYRQYIKDSLYDRICTRPFLISIEKKWLAFQLLCALNQCHKIDVCHGDIKSENVMITSWNWLFLVDFASFKPTHLPNNNPAIFSYFFDTSRRRTCYIAPERFVEISLDDTNIYSNSEQSSNESNEEKLNPAMDIFSAGCVLAELFSEGTPPFDLSMLLAYQGDEYNPIKSIEDIEDINIQKLILHMIQKDPKSRHTAEEYLVQQRNRAFPDYFYTVLKPFIQRFATEPIVPADDRIAKISENLDQLFEQIGVDDDPENNSVLVLIISLVTSSLRNLHYCSSKIDALRVMLRLSEYVTADIILDRLIPFMLYLISDSQAQVRSEAVRVITQCLASVDNVPTKDANIFPEYILPILDNLTHDPSSLVRIAFAENIAVLANTALKFLEIVQSNTNILEQDAENSSPKGSYDKEIHALHEMIRQKVIILLSNSENIVKRTLLEHGITDLCIFFGRQKANDVLLSHIITFLNDKNDWHLRGAFFDCIVGVASYVGWQSSSILKPLLQQGLVDSEEFVIHKALTAIKSLTDLGLLQKNVMIELLNEISPLLCHPGVWIRQAAVCFITTISSKLNIADVHCKVLPAIQPFLQRNIKKVDDEVILLSALMKPLSRPVYDYVLRYQHIDSLFESLNIRQLIRNLNFKNGNSSTSPEFKEDILQVLRKLNSQGMTEGDEDILLAMRDFIHKLHQYRAGSAEPNQSKIDEDNKNGIVDLNEWKIGVPTHRADLVTKDLNSRKVSSSSSTALVEIQEFYSESRDADSQEYVTNEASVSDEKNVDIDALKPKFTQTKSIYGKCYQDVHELIEKKQNEYKKDKSTNNACDFGAWEMQPPRLHWKPRGWLIAHLHEHKSAVNRLRVSHDYSIFASCSNDETVKIWDCINKIEQKKHFSNRSWATYTIPGAQVKSLVFCERSKSIAAASDDGTIRVFRLEIGAKKECILRDPHTKNLDVGKDGLITDMVCLDAGEGSQSIITYATVHGYIIGWDLRSPKTAWLFENDPKLGLITSFDVHHSQSWLAVGTSKGSHVCWDMRFQLPITTVKHPKEARIRRLLTHPKEQSSIISASQGNNEISVWDLETSARQKTLWASTAPALSTTKESSHSVNGMYMGVTENSAFILSGGSDMRIRYWDMLNPASSHIVAPAGSDPVTQPAVSYESRMVDGTDVIQEMYRTKQEPSNEETPRYSPEPPSSGHHDVISDIAICQSELNFQKPQCFIISSSRDGVIKVWK